MMLKVVTQKRGAEVKAVVVARLQGQLFHEGRGHQRRRVPLTASGGVKFKQKLNPGLTGQ